MFFSENEPSPVVIHDEALVNITPFLKGALLLGGVEEPIATILANQYGQSRQANENDLLVLTSQGAISSVNEEYFNYLTGIGVPPEQAGQLSLNGLTYPMEDRWVLLPSEQEAVMNATEAYNQAISAVVTQKGLGFVDSKGLLEQLSEGGVASDGLILTGDYVTGGAFSLDGIHLNARGYAFLANEFLKSIDETYGSNFKDAGALVDIGKYPPLYGPILP